MSGPESSSRVSTGISGLDELTCGGLPGGRAYILRGGPGTGKTIVALHFLTAGVEAGDDPLFVAFEEPAADLRQNAAGLGFDLDGVEILDLSPSADRFLEDRSYTAFEPSEVEGHEPAERIVEAVRERDPKRVVIDPLTGFRLLAPDNYQFRQEMASLTAFLKNRDVTALYTTQPTPNSPDDDLQFLGDGILTLSRSDTGRRIEVEKLRGSDFRGGSHAMRIRNDGIHVFPSLVPGDYDREFTRETLSSGIAELDQLLGGGFERGTVSVITGPSGVGKTTTGTHFMKEAAARGERSTIYLFEEATEQFTYRSEAIDIPVDRMMSEGNLGVEEIEPMDLSADEFAHQVRMDVEENGTEVVMIDGTAGYRLSLRDEDGLLEQLHTLCRYLRNVGVTVILIEEQQSVAGEFSATQENISYLADSILFLRYLELDGEIRKSIGVLKKRLGGFERTLRELEIGEDGLHVGDPMTDLRGILTGTPERVDESDD
ncbi:ATPase domain-containing protein [Haloglomus halophilum]|uniref:ATPase domain-containing protein n=1 Tax=Haloglomus halophilum TaxID=2962672 RepID=UPI0020CA00A9|nr:ATPase domain-containing protein [Haloglomus halophilum]